MEAKGYILRVATKEWVEQVFSMAIYYTNLRRKWKSEQTILFIHRTNAGDAVVGYGIIESVYSKEELSDEERINCEKQRWNQAIGFKYVVRFEKPLLVKETFLKASKFRGRYAHGLPLSRDQLSSLMSQAELLQR